MSDEWEFYELDADGLVRVHPELTEMELRLLESANLPSE